MQKDLGKRQGARRYAGARPLADLQQNVLSGPAKTWQQSCSSQTGVIAKAISPVAAADTSNLDPVQLRLTSIGLLQYAAIFAKEEIDEEALPCLTVQDLQSLGITNAAHQRLILSAAMQPATQTVARPGSTARPAHLYASRLNATLRPAPHSSASVSSTNSTSDVLPIRALPAGGLHSIAVAVASRQSKTAGTGTGALVKALRPSVHNAMGALSAAASHPRAAAATTGAVAPGKSAGIIKGTSKPTSSTVKPAAAAGTVKAITSAAVTVNKAAGLPQNIKSNPGVKGVAKPIVAALETGKPAAVASMAGPATASCAEPAISKHRKATAASSGRAVVAEKGSSTLAAAAASKGTAAPAPRSKADEARQLAMALSASMGADADELASTTEGLPSSAASQGVFMTMMAASRSKSVPTAMADLHPSVPPIQSFSRSQEEVLLERVFITSLAASSVPVVGPAYSSQRQPDSLSQAQAIRVSESLWARAACSDPPECQLQDRVHKRKAAAEMHRQMVKRQSLEAVTDAVMPCISNAAHQSQGPKAASVDTIQFSGQATSSTPSGDTDCIIVTSPSVPVHDQTTAKMSQSMGDDICVPPVDVQTMDPMKRMQWQALQQELKAARQTVADLERMIRTLEQS
ncbi:hypothetical protein WJX77_003618 [Trebouxia sp. C0004]